MSGTGQAGETTVVDAVDKTLFIGGKWVPAAGGRTFPALAGIASRCGLNSPPAAAAASGRGQDSAGAGPSYRLLPGSSSRTASSM